MAKTPEENLLWSRFERKMRDSQQVRGPYEKLWQENQQLANLCQNQVFPHRREWPYYAIDRISNVIITKASVQTEQTPKAEFIPRTSYRPTLYVLKDATIAQALGVDAQGDMQWRDGLLAQIDPETQEPLLGADDFYEISSATATQWLQDQFDVIWDMTHCTERVKNNIYDTLVFGCQDMMTQWDDDREVFIRQNIYPYFAWIDRHAESTTDAKYFILMEALDVEEAKMRYNLTDDQVKKYQSNSLGQLTWSSNMGDQYDRLQDRPIIEHYIWFQKDELIDIDADEAVEMGLVKEVEVAGEGLRPEMVYHNEDGQPVSPGEPGWPKTYGLKQIEFLGQDVIFNGPSSFPDIPVARNFNIKVPKQPYGQGEPERLKPLQELFNRLWTIYAQTSEFNSNELKVIPKSVQEEFSKLSAEFFSRPDLSIAVPDHRLLSLGGAQNMVAKIDGAQLSNVVSEMMQLVIREFDVLSGVGPILRGEAKSDWSGSLAEQLADLARGPLGFIARSTSDALRYLARIDAQMIVDYLSPETAAERCPQYPANIHAMFQEYIGDVGYDIRVEVTGGGFRREQKETALRLMELGLSNLSPTLMEWALSQLKVPDPAKVAREVSILSQPPAAPSPEDS